VVRRSEAFELWCGRAFLTGWFAALFYFDLVLVDLVFDLPWQPLLGFVRAMLFAIVLCGFLAVPILLCRYLFQHRLEPLPMTVTWQGRIIGLVVDPVPDTHGGNSASLLAANSPEAMEFLTSLNGTPDEECLVLVDGITSWMQLSPDESGKTRVRWRDSSPIDRE
jgi:hypothetical protein